VIVPLYQVMSDRSDANNGRRDRCSEEARPRRCWRDIVTLAALAVLGIAPWAQAQLQSPQPPPPVVCPPLTAIATPTFFDVIFGTIPFRFPFQ